jgi:hypothetical protein
MKETGLPGHTAIGSSINSTALVGFNGIGEARHPSDQTIGETNVLHADWVVKPLSKSGIVSNIAQ